MDESLNQMDEKMCMPHALVHNFNCEYCIFTKYFNTKHRLAQFKMLAEHYGIGHLNDQLVNQERIRLDWKTIQLWIDGLVIEAKKHFMLKSDVEAAIASIKKYVDDEILAIKNGLEQDDLYRELANEAAAHKKRKAQFFEGHPEGGQSSKVPSLPQNETDKKRKALRSKADEGHPEAGQSSKVPSLPQSETDKNGKASVHEGHPEAGQSSKVPSHNGKASVHEGHPEAGQSSKVPSHEEKALRSPPSTALLQRAVNDATRRARGRWRGFKAR